MIKITKSFVVQELNRKFPSMNFSIDSQNNVLISDYPTGIRFTFFENKNQNLDAEKQDEVNQVFMNNLIEEILHFLRKQGV